MMGNVLIPHPYLCRKAQEREQDRTGTGLRAKEGYLLGFLEEVDPELGIGD